MKKVLSLLLTFSMIIPTMIFATVSASDTASDSSIYTTLNNLNCHAVGFLSSEKAGTYTEETGKDLNFFGTWSQPRTLAISKESFEKLPHDENGIYTINGTPYNVNTADGEKTVGYSQGWTNITKQRYSKIKALVAFPITTDWKDSEEQQIRVNDTIYLYVKYDDANTNANGNDTEVGNEMNQSGGMIVANDQVEWATVKKDDIAPSNKVNLREFTFNLNTTKELKQYCLVPAGDMATPARVLAITTVDVYGDEWIPVIENKITSIFENEDGISETELSELESLIEKAKSEGVNISTVSNIDKYNKYKKIIADSYTTLDMKGHYNSEIYLASDEVGKIETATYPHYFMPTTSNNGDEVYSKKPYAISKETMESKLTNGIYTSKKGTPYKIVDSDGKMASLNASANGSFSYNDYCSEIKVLVAYGSRWGYGDNGLYEGVYYSYTNNTNNDPASFDSVTEDFVERLPAVQVTGVDVANEYVDLYEITYKITDKTKKIKRIDFYSNDSSSKRILGIATVGLVGSEWIPVIEAEIEALPEEGVTEDAVSAVTDLIEKAKAAGADVSKVSNIEKYKTLKKQFLKEAYIPFDISSYYNSKIYLSNAKAGTIESAAYPDYFMTGKQTDSNGQIIESDTKERIPYAISKEFMDGKVKDGVYTVSGVPYKVNTPDDEAGSVDCSNKNKAFGGTPDYYSKIKFLYVMGPVQYGNDDLYATFKYENGENATLTKTSKWIEWATVKTVRANDSLPTDNNENTVSGQLIESTYEVSDKTKKLKEWNLYAKPENRTRIIGITAVDLLGDEWIPVLQNEISELSDDTSAVTKSQFEEIDALVKRAEKNGADLDSVSNIAKYNALKEIFENKVNVSNCEVAYENDNITVNVTFDKALTAEDIEKDNFVLTCGRTNVDYTVTAVKTGDNVIGATIGLKNSIASEDSYQLKVKIGDSCNYETTFSVPKPIAVENDLLKNSTGAIVDRVSDIKDGKIIFTADIKNNTYKDSKVVKIITAIYNDNQLYGIEITDADIDYEKTYSLNKEMTVPTTGLNEKWTTKMFVWAEDCTTPLTVSKNKTFGIDAVNDTAKDLTVAFIGGSITQGGNYTKPFIEKWQQDRTGKITSINAGIGGTDSFYGSMRLYEDVLKKKPDVVFVEFTLNDGYLTETQIKKNVESMIRQAYNCEHQPIISFIYIPDRRTNSDGSYTLSKNIEYYNAVMPYYGLTGFNAHQLVVDAVTNNECAWDDIVASNNVHPTVEQGKKIADIMYNEFKNNNSKYVKNIVWNPTKGFGADDYNKPVCVSSKAGNYDSDWQDSKVQGVVTEGYGVPTSLPFECFMASSKSGAEMSFKFSGTKLLISTLWGSNGRSASYVITDSQGTIEKSGTMSNYLANQAWYENISLSLDGLKDGEHTITVTVNDGTGLFGIGEIWIDE